MESSAEPMDVADDDEQDYKEEENSARALDSEDPPQAETNDDDGDDDEQEGDGDEGSASDQDKKPAAKGLSTKGAEAGDRGADWVSDQGEDGNDDSSTSGSENEGDSKDYVTEDGRKLSEYEIQRLERIKRNREYLAKLGLQGKDGGGVLGQKKKKKKPPAKKSTEVPIVRRSTLSRRSKNKKVVTYTEPPASVRDLLRVADKKAANAPVDLKLPTPEKEELVAASEPPKPPPDNETKKPKKSRGVNERQEAFVYLEFKRLQSSKNQMMRQAERNERVAEKEVKYWHKLVARWERRSKKQLEAERQRQAEVKEREALGGKTIKELLHEIDGRMPLIVTAVKRYDDCLQAENRKLYIAHMRAEAEEKMKMLDAVDRFPKAMKNAVSMLNAMFVERAPKDPPPPRRSKRSAADDEPQSISSPEKKVEARGNGKSDSPPMNDDDIRLAEPTLSISGTEDGKNGGENEKPKATGVKKRIRVVRNVGGWVSPEFSADIDRSWLAGETPPDHFDLSKYVPQVGDTVLYYISGHKKFLAQYPDYLAKKARLKSRIPLWTRAAQMKEDGGETSGDAAGASKSWWTEDWLEGVESFGLGDYPLLCRVERTDVEFPPDPCFKVVKKDDASGSTKLYFRKPKNLTKDSASSQLRLSVGLRPLTPLEMPAPWDERGPDSGSASCALPPSFSVVTFPSKKLEPFLVPFGWAYRRAHSLSLNQKVIIRPGNDQTKIRVDEFRALSDGRKMRLEENEAVIQKCLAFFDCVPSKNVALEDLLKKQQQLGAVPLRDARVVLDVWSRNITRDAPGNDVPPAEAPPFVVLVRKTLPLWKGVAVMRTMYDRKKKIISPWRLVVPSKERELSCPWILGEHSYTLDEPLRVKIELLLEEIVAENSSAADLFFQPVTEDIAPSYFCAVPIGMSLSIISQRLRSKGKGPNKLCYYRSVDAILSDVASIVDNCLLYNSPEAEVVGEAANLVSLIKDRIGKVVNGHYQEMKEARKIDDQRRRLVLERSSAVGTGHAPKSSANVFTTLRKPFKESLHREWLDSVCQNAAQSQSPSTVCSAGETTGVSKVTFCPQVGDHVLYSRALHDQFVKGHYPSLEADQCLLPSLDGIDGSSPSAHESTDGWIKGEIMWARSCFPKVPAKQSKEDSNTFSSMATLLALGIKFQGRTGIFSVYWRPCLFHFDDTAATKGVCPGCGLQANDLFLRLESETSLQNGSFSADRQYSASANALSPSACQSIGRCIDLLKRRCLKSIPPAFVDPQQTKENIKAGYKVPPAKVGKSSLPDFDKLFRSPRDANPTPAISHHGTRGVSMMKPLKEDPTVGVLKDAGFLPVWVSRKAEGSVDDSLLRKAGTIVPSPKICLEQIQLRLRNGYYRHPAAVENDLAEAYVCTVFLMISSAATRKKSPVSVRRVARALSAKKDILNDSDNIDAKLKEEEADWARRLRLVRELYAAALVSVSDTIHTERVFGLATVTTRPVFEKAKDPDIDRVAARQKLAYILHALSRDDCLNSFGDAREWGMPTMKLSITCDGKPFSYDSKSYTVRSSPLRAKLYDNLFDVKVIWQGKPFSCGNVSLVENPPTNGRAKKQVTAPPIYFGPDVYQKNDVLSRLFFRRQGKANACARCQAYKRSMMACRVARRHSNLDLDWLSTLPGGTSHVDELLKTLESLEGNSNEEMVENGDLSTNLASKDGATEKEPNPQEEDNDDGNGEEDEKSNKNAKEAEDDDGRVGDEDDEDEDDGEEKNASKESKFGDPRAFSNKAEMALQLSKEVLVEIKRFAEAPARLSKEFIEESFPVDDDDGHYLYCIICGLSGNLLCCDGCPVVAHTECVGLTDLPEGDWFCEECNMKETAAATKGGGRQSEAEADAEHIVETAAATKGGGRQSEAEADAEHIVETAAATKGGGRQSEAEADAEHIVLPFGRVEYDSEKFDRVTAMLDELRSSRPTGKAKKKKVDHENDEDEDADDDGEDVDEVSRRGRGKRFRRPADSDDSEEEEMPPLKRRRKQIDEHLAVSPSPKKQNISRTSLEEKRKAAQTRVSGRKSQDHRHKTKKVDNPFAILTDTQKEFLRSMGIRTAKTFLETRTADIAPKFVRWRAKKGMSVLKGTGPSASVSSWKTTVRKAVEEMGRERSDSEPEEDEEQVEEEEGVAENDDSSGEEEEDPLEALSATTLAFLESIGITTAVSFLSQRSSDIAPKFVEWRAEEGMAELKGSGPVASVSAWKTTVRNRARQMGLHHVARLEPSDKSVRSPTPQKQAVKRKQGANTERPSKKKSAKRVRRVNSRRGVPESENGSKDDDEEEEEEDVSDDESSTCSQNNRGNRRQIRPPPRFIDIQESLAAGKKVGKTGITKKQTRKSSSRGKRKGIPRSPPEGFFVEDVEILKKP